MTADTLISIQQVNFSYGSELVLDDINLQVKRGEFLGVIGPNGSGKTTLLKIMLGLLQPTAGSVTLFGQPVTEFHNWQKVGYVAQKAASSASHFPLTVAEVVGMGKIDQGNPFFSGSEKAAVEQALQAVGMASFHNHLLSELSGGQQQRVFIARALVSQPELLILDEPTVGVDSESQTNFYQLLKELNQKHQLTLILISHDIDVVAHEVKTVACMNKKLIFHGEPKKVFSGNFMAKLYGKHVRLVVHEH